MRKIRFLRDYDIYKKGEVVEMERERADRLLIAMIVTVVF